jgi:hypothetical protein
MTYNNVDSVVATMVATQTLDNGCVELMLPDDLSEVIRLWPLLSNEIKRAVIALVRSAGEVF